VTGGLRHPHHDPSERWVSNPRPDPGETVTVTVDVPSEASVDRMLLRAMHDGEARWIEGRGERSATGHTWSFDLTCHNPVVHYRFWCGGTGGSRWLTGRGTLRHDPLDHHDFRLLTTGGTPRWVPETVWYQIFPDRFATSGRHRDAFPDWAVPANWDDPVAPSPHTMTQLYGGDLDGIVERLDHLVDLGVGGLYLTPIFPAHSNHRYDASSFDTIDPALGGDEALVRLREACSRAGLRLINDLTLNHTGDRHEWFTAAQADASSEEAGYYYFRHHPDEYESWLDVPSLPKINHTSGPMRRRFYDGPDSVLGRYLRPPYSIDGWRIDVANMTGRYGMQDHNALVRSTSRRTSDAVSPDRWLVAEHWFDASLDVMGDGWHGVMNYTGVTRPIVSWLGELTILGAMMPGPGQDARDGIAVADAMDDARGAMPWQSLLGSMALLGSHDTARWRSMARTDELALVGFGLLMTMPGAPCFLYGDEIGLAAPDNERARSPMPWDRSRWDAAWLDTYRAWIRLRAGSVALAHGGFRWVERAPDALAFLRETEHERVLVRSTRARTEDLAIPIDRLGARSIDRVIGEGTCTVVSGTATFTSESPSTTVWRVS
jgi:alpha-glucosidase